MMTIGERIKQLRLERNLTQQELADRLGTSKQAIYKYENGVVTNIPLDRLEQLANILSTTTSYLTGWEENNEQNKATPDYHDVKVALFGGDGEVTDEMWEEVKQFADFVKAKHLKEKK